jgi:hypothetical protein
VYIANRNETNRLRASLHSSGKWFFHVGGQNRAPLAPPFLLPGEDWLHALELAFLIADGTVPVHERREVKPSKPALAIDTPTDHKLALNILLGARRDTAHDAPLPDIMKGPVLMRSRLASGVPVVVVGRVVPFSDQDREVLQYHQVTLGVRVNVSGPEPVKDPQGELLRITWSPQGNVLTVFALSPTAFHHDATGS